MRSFVRRLFCSLALLSFAPPTVSAQVFTKLTDLTNPAVADSGALGFAGASWVDFDRDGWDDLFVGDRALYRNVDGTAFVRKLIPNNRFTLGNSWADFDNDGDTDLMTTSSARAGHGSRFFRNDTGDFVQVTGGVIGDSLTNVGWSCSWGDYDADGFVDLAIANAAGFTGSTPNHLLHNEGNGTFTRHSTTDVTVGLAPYTVPSWSDFDLDGDLDLSIGAGPANGTKGPDYFYRNLRLEGGSPLLDRITTGVLATDVRDGQIVNWIDYDNDRDLDCYITNYLNSANHLYRNDGGTYVRMTGAQAGPIVTDVAVNTASVWNDYDNDGDLDCFVVRSPCRYYRNEGNGLFASLALGAITSSPANTAVASDYDKDGDVDLYLSTPGPGKGIYRNDLAPGNHWLEVRLTGSTSNRSAIGTRVRVLATIGGIPVWQMREVSAQNSFNGHSSFVQHFGLGDANLVDSLIIEWPGGLRETLVDVSGDTCLDLVEGGSTPTPALATLVEAHATDAGVELVWYGRGLSAAAATVYRKASEGTWVSLGAPRQGDPDRVDYFDPTPGEGRVAYRLGIVQAGDEWFTAETVVDLEPSHFDLRVAASWAGARQLSLEFDLPRPGETRIEVFDVAGRRAASEMLGVLPRGRHSRVLSAASWRAGIYFVKLSQAGHSAGTKALVLP